MNNLDFNILYIRLIILNKFDCFELPLFISGKYQLKFEFIELSSYNHIY